MDKWPPWILTEIFSNTHMLLARERTYSQWRWYFSFFLLAAAGSLPCALMDVAKAALNNASTKHESVAIRAENKSYSYAQLSSSACKISNLLCSGDFKSVSWIAETIVKYHYLSACTVVRTHSHRSSEVTNAVFSHEHNYLILSIQVAIWMIVSKSFSWYAYVV